MSKETSTSLLTFSQAEEAIENDFPAFLKRNLEVVQARQNFNRAYILRQLTEEAQVVGEESQSYIQTHALPLDIWRTYWLRASEERVNRMDTPL